MEWVLFQMEEEDDKTLNAQSLLSESIMEQRPKEKDKQQFDNKENMSKTVLEREAIVKSSVEYFKEDALAADVWINKYALRDGDNIYELNPDQMHRRLAKEFARIENKYTNPLSEEEIYEEFQITPSTIRNYRQKLREKQQQAKLLSALSELVRDEKRKGTMHLNRKEKAIIQQYFTQDGYLKEIPSKSKKKIVVLKHIIQPLKTGKKYSENELNKYLKSRTVQCSEVKESLMEQGLIIVDEQNNYYKKLK